MLEQKTSFFERIFFLENWINIRNVMVNWKSFKFKCLFINFQTRILILYISTNRSSCSSISDISRRINFGSIHFYGSHSLSYDCLFITIRIKSYVCLIFFYGYINI